jgi:hypothetical protein
MPQLPVSYTASRSWSAVATLLVTVACVLVGYGDGRLAAADGSLPARTPRPADPELPRQFLDTHYTPPTGRTIAVRAGGNLQAALDAARPCDVLTLEPGATFAGSFILPNKSGSCWITIRTGAADSRIPAQGVRVTPSYAPVMPKLVSPGNGASALSTAPGAHNYRLIGLELTTAATVTETNSIVSLGDGSGAQNSTGRVPHDLILDRVYVHGHPRLNMQRCISLQSASTAVIDSYVAECHGKGFDSQAICGWNGPGPFKIVNNYLEGAGENIMFGGADAAIANLTPSDIEIRHNHITRPAAWKGVWTVKNLLELKHAERVLIEGNLFENHWLDGQDGSAIVLKSVNQDGRAPWSVTRDITFRFNRLRNIAGGVAVAARPEVHPAVPASRMKFSDNVFDNVNVGVFTGNGRLFQLFGELDDIIIEHNTAFTSHSVILFSALPQITRFVFADNLTTHGQYGVFGSDFGEGTPAIDHYVAPGYLFERNVIIGGTSRGYPPRNFYPATIADVGFVDVGSGNYRLRTTSSFSKQARDGRDPGANIYAVDRAIRGAP